jgi:hypothetical protein
MMKYYWCVCTGDSSAYAVGNALSSIMAAPHEYMTDTAICVETGGLASCIGSAAFLPTVSTAHFITADKNGSFDRRYGEIGSSIRVAC